MSSQSDKLGIRDELTLSTGRTLNPVTKSPTKIIGEITAINGLTGKKMFTFNDIIIPGATFAIEKMFGIRSSFGMTTLSQDLGIKADVERTLEKLKDELIFGFVLGTGGVDVPELVKAVQFRDKTVENLVPIRVTPVGNDLTPEDRAKYALRKQVGDKYHYYAKKFNTTPVVRHVFTDGTEIPPNIDQVETSLGLLVFGEIAFTVSQEDLREYFIDMYGNIDNCRFNSMGLVTGFPDGDDYAGVRVATKINMPNMFSKILKDTTISYTRFIASDQTREGLVIILRLLNDDEVKELLSLKYEDITMSLLKSYFARKVSESTPRFTVSDYFILPENSCSNNLRGYTTIGLYLFNRLVTDRAFSEVTGYVNTPITGKTLNKIYDLISQAFFDDRVEYEQFAELINMLDFLGGGDLAEIINVSLSNRLFILPPKVRQRRDELFKKYKNEIEAGDVNTGAIIEKELVELTKKELEGTPEWDNFASDAKLNFDNNYKTVMLMKGPVLNTGTGEWEIATSNYDDGISKEEYALLADSSVFGAFQRAKGVAMGGYAVKKFISTLQDVQAAEEGSDCGTKDYLTVTIDPFFKNEYTYMYMVEGTKLVQLTPDNFKEYEGKTVKLRSPVYCKHPSPKLCNKCIGEHPYKVNLEKIGLAATKIGSTLMNRRLKAFHNKKVYMYEVSVDDLL